MADRVARAGQVPALNALRGMAALLIGVMHSFYASGRPNDGHLGIASTLDSGYLAVDFFFVLSGFVLFLPAARRAGDIGGYGGFMIKRVTRLWPAYALVLTAALLAHPLTGVRPAPLPPSAAGDWNVLAHVVLLPTVLLGYGVTDTGLGVDAVVWSLSVEMCFSLVLPLVARWWFRHPAIGLVAALVVSRGWVFATTTWGPGSHPGTDASSAAYLAGARLVISLPTYALHFGVGMSLAYLIAVHGDAVRARLAGRAAVITFLLGASLTAATACLLGSYEYDLGGYGHWTLGGVMLPAFALLIVSACVVEGRTGAILGSAAGRRLAEASYPFYLMHLVVMKAVRHQDPLRGWPGFALCLASLPVSFGLALVVHRCVELPASEWGRRVAARRGASHGTRSAPRRPLEAAA